MRILALVTVCLAACGDDGEAWPRSPRPLDPALRLAIIASIDDEDLGAGTAIRTVEPGWDERRLREYLASEGQGVSLREITPIADGFDARVIVLDRPAHLIYRNVGGRGYVCQTLGHDDADTELRRRSCLAFYRDGDRLVLPFALGDEGIFAEYGRGSISIGPAREPGPVEAKLSEERDQPPHHRFRAYVRRRLAGLDVVCEQDGADRERIRLAFERCLTLHAAR